MNIYQYLLCKSIPPSPPLSFLTNHEISGTGAHQVKVFNLKGELLSRTEPYSSFLHSANRQAPIAATAFHPHRMVLACAARDNNHVNLFGCAEKKEESSSQHEGGYGWPRAPRT